MYMTLNGAFQFAIAALEQCSYEQDVIDVIVMN